MDPFVALAAQRRAIADVLDSLEPEQWDTPTLCQAWTVHDLAAHLVSPWEVPLWRMGLAILRARGDFDRASRIAVARVAARPSAELVAILRDNADSRWTPPANDWHAPLTDNYVHALDLCIPLGLEAPADPAQWPVILEWLVSPKARRGFVSGELPAVRFTATDVGWASGEGPEVSGPAAALALAVLGRTALVDRLEGPGAADLAAFADGPGEATPS